MSTKSKYLNELIEYFIHHSRRERCHFLLSRPLRRDEGAAEFGGPAYFDPRCLVRAFPLPPVERPIHEVLHRWGCGDSCYVVSILPEVDGRIMPTDEALDECVDSCRATILYFPKGKVGFYESEALKCSCFLQRVGDSFNSCIYL